MTCKDCVHYEVCEAEVEAHHDNPRELETDGIEDFCEFFKPKSRFVEVKHGKWEVRTFIIFDSEKVGYRCSECNTTWDSDTKYCPYCGAKMDGEKTLAERSK